jgi:hypothetical protein
LETGTKMKFVFLFDFLKSLVTRCAIGDILSLGRDAHCGSKFLGN